MAVTPVTFYDPSSPFGAIAGWEIQTGGDPTKSKQQEVDFGSTGDILAAEDYDARSTVSATYKLTTRTGGGAMTLPKVGSVLNGYHVDGFSLAMGQNNSPVLTVNGHKHDDGNGHTDGTMNEYTCTLKFIVQGIGVPSSIVDTEVTPNTIFALVEGASVGLRSLTYSLAVTHDDELDGGGEHLAGENRDGIETLEIEFTGGAAETDDYTIDANWFVGSETPNQGNTSVKTKSITATQHIARDAA